ncbi:C40 family peptidase [Fictibacillus barbaricus]|uniref:Cell wall-associated NlpC family hydrolase n=1 Tax=Fictibacillus barbaricus TaxID=182136 RepID=A0ABU1U671_9BACL|nr:C40 family peptidase [Fictibacillus barbaricus]MDR7074926.1 cell wall-associated NlpC family hydrolase [Fictibacillus barbaricus]
MKRIFSVFVSLGLAAMFLLSGVSVAKASPSYDQEVTETAKVYLGTPYKWGGTTAKGFDASGFTKFIYKTTVVKKDIPRTAADQFKGGAAVAKGKEKLGDLVFFKTNGKSVSFVGIYLGNNSFIAATTKGVRIQSMNTKYWKDIYSGARRYLR